MYEILKERFGNSPIRYKLMVIGMLTSILVMLVASVIFTIYNVVATKQAMVNELSFASEIIGSNISPYIEFSQKKAAEKTLSSLNVKESIILVCTYDINNKLFAQYHSSQDKEYFCPVKFTNGYNFKWNNFTITKDIIEKDAKIGTIYILSDLRDIKQQVTFYLVSLVVSVFFVLIVAYLISARLQKIISSPILYLAEVTKYIEENADYSMRAEKIYNDETGELVDSFNQMLDEVQKKDNGLKELNNTITEMVDNLGQGFLTFTEDGRCGKVYSRTCEELFGVSPAGLHIEDVLKLDKKERDKFTEWLELVFSKGHALRFEDMKIFAPSQYKHSENKRIILDYKAIYNNSGIEKIILIATDESKIMAAENLVKKYQSDAEIITKISYAKDYFINFITHTKEVLNSLTTKVTEYNIAEIKMNIHTVKGVAAVFAMDAMVKNIHNFENELKEVNKANLEYLDFHVKFDTHIDKIRNELDRILNLVGNLVGDIESQKNIINIGSDKLFDFAAFLKKSGTKDAYVKYINDIIAVPVSSCLNVVSSELEMLAYKKNKEIDAVTITGEPDLPVITQYYHNLFLSFTHICRNIIDHGVESPEVREKAGKSRKAHVNINISRILDKGQEFLQIRFSDDGAGINADEIRLKLESMKYSGNWKNESDEKIIQHIFDTGFSIKNKASTISGQGVGMSAVKQEVEKLGGNIWVESKPAFGTNLYIIVPYLLNI